MQFNQRVLLVLIKPLWQVIGEGTNLSLLIWKIKRYTLKLICLYSSGLSILFLMRESIQNTPQGICMNKMLTRFLSIIIIRHSCFEFWKEIKGFSFDAQNDMHRMIFGFIRSPRSSPILFFYKGFKLLLSVRSFRLIWTCWNQLFYSSGADSSKGSLTLHWSISKIVLLPDPFADLSLLRGLDMLSSFSNPCHFSAPPSLLSKDLSNSTTKIPSYS